MKFVIQIGNNAGKKELESFVSIMPGEWRNLFNTIVVYGSRNNELEITHHEKEKVLGIHCPITYKGTSAETLEEVAICVGALNDIGRIPKKMSASRREHYLNAWRKRNTPNN